eukprot:229636-Amphidinium_carterae.3
MIIIIIIIIKSASNHHSASYHHPFILIHHPEWETNAMEAEIFMSKLMASIDEEEEEKEEVADARQKHQQGKAWEQHLYHHQGPKRSPKQRKQK